MNQFTRTRLTGVNRQTILSLHLTITNNSTFLKHFHPDDHTTLSSFTLKLKTFTALLLLLLLLLILIAVITIISSITHYNISFEGNNHK